MNQAVPRSSYTLLALAIGVVLSVATTCGPPDPVPWEGWDTAGRWDTGGGGGGGGSTWDVGYTVDDEADLRLDGVGDTVVKTVRVTLTEDCLAEVPAYAWGYPTGWTVLGVSLTAAESADTGVPDTGPDTAEDTARDTAEDTAPDTGGDSGGGSASDARFHVTVVRSDGLTVLDDTFGLYDDIETTARASDLEAFTSCVKDTACEVDWQVTVTLTEGSAAEGELNVHSRIQMCSSGEGDASHIAVAVE